MQVTVQQLLNLALLTFMRFFFNWGRCDRIEGLTVSAYSIIIYLRLVFIQGSTDYDIDFLKGIFLFDR